MSTRDYIVQVVAVTRKGRRTWGFAASDEDPADWFPTDGYTVSAYRVTCTTKVEAAPTVAYWLSQGRPAAMTVRQVFPRQPRPSERRAPDSVIDEMVDVMAAHWQVSRFVAAERIVEAIQAPDDDAVTGDAAEKR